MKYVVTSDIHLGSKHSRAEPFQGFVAKLGKGVCLILAGDIIDDPKRILTRDHQQALDAIIARSKENRVIWVHGNHDDNYKPPLTETIAFCKEYSIGQRLFITHGDHFDNVMPYNRYFLWCFSLLHRLRILLGAHPVHVAQFAKKFGVLYRFLRKNVAQNAVEHAKENNVDAVACGHVHYAEDVMIEGIRYINLGAWTEEPAYCLLVDSESLKLVTIEEAMSDTSFFS